MRFYGVTFTVTKEDDEYRPLTHKEQVRLYKQRLKEEKKRKEAILKAQKNGKKPKAKKNDEAYEIRKHYPRPSCTGDGGSQTPGSTGSG